MIIDCHTHLNNYKNENEDQLLVRLSELQKEMKRNRVDHAVVLTSFREVPGRPSTQRVAEAVKDLPYISVVAGIQFATLDEAQVKALETMLMEKKIKGLKIYPGYEPFFPSDPKLEPIYRLAEAFDVPVMIHTGDTLSPHGKIKFAHPLNVDEVAVDYPKVKFIICHMGNPWFQDTMEIIYKNANVYADISGLVLGNFTDRFESYISKKFQEMFLFGMEPSKVLFGTDWPIATIDSYLDLVDSLAIPVAEKNMILFENAAKIFKISVRDSMFALPRRSE